MSAFCQAIRPIICNETIFFAWGTASEKYPAGKDSRPLSTVTACEWYCGGSMPSSNASKSKSSGWAAYSSWKQSWGRCMGKSRIVRCSCSPSHMGILAR
eukprot:9472111-Pyramimonas_sp.AAC.1